MLSLYIHVPFCNRKCPYCGFYSTRYSLQSADNYVVALGKEALRYKDDFSEQVFQTIYIGGGTPTVLSHEQSFGIIKVIQEHFRQAEGAEFTVEANPNSATMQSLSVWRSLGVNRLSLGIQSFSDDVLHKLGRLHTGGQAVDSFRLSRSLGFDNIGIDLIYGVPGQTKAQWEVTIAMATQLAPEHISLYSLSLDGESEFKRYADSGKFVLPDDEVTAEWYEYAVSVLRDAGYSRYELSNFSLPGRECRHNMNYWEQGEYLGLGPSAASFISRRRFHTVSDHQEYARRLACGQSVVEESETLTREQSAYERLLLGLRTAHGVDLPRFEREFGDSIFNRLLVTLGPLSDAGLLLIQNGHVSLTDRGILLCNEVLTRMSV
ncbi:MAG TPA: radical SAM family heme chaperone HemW [Nitrospirota bacterium]|nr:radical SAM family heme chaperone HemW [Nitrospirota bacterium]